MYAWGYEFVDIVQVPGEISYRGDIIDIFLPSRQNPLRISLFDNQIEQIKEFDAQTQKTMADEIETIIITAAYFSLSQSEHERLMQKIQNSNDDSFIKDIPSLGYWYLEELSTNILSNKHILASKAADLILQEALQDEIIKAHAAKFLILHLCRKQLVTKSFVLLR